MYKKITTIEEHSDVPFSQGNGIVARDGFRVLLLDIIHQYRMCVEESNE